MLSAGDEQFFIVTHRFSHRAASLCIFGICVSVAYFSQKDYALGNRRVGVIFFAENAAAPLHDARKGRHYSTRRPRPVEPSCRVVMTLAVIMLCKQTNRTRGDVVMVCVD